MNVIQPRPSGHHLRLHAEGYPEILLFANRIAKKSAWGYSNNDIRVFVEPHRLPYNGRIFGKFPDPELVAHDGNRVRGFGLIIFRHKGTSAKRGHSEYGKVVAGNEIYRCVIGNNTGRCRLHGDAVFLSGCSHAGKYVIAIPKIAVKRI